MRVRDRFAAWCRETFGPVEFSTHPLCSICGRACALVSDAAYACSGPRLYGQCIECVDVLELTPEKTCPDGPRHLVVNVTNRRPASLSVGTPYSRVAPALRPEIGA